MNARILAWVIVLATGGCASTTERTASEVDAANERTQAKAREQIARGEAIDVKAESDAAVATIDEAARNAKGMEGALLRASSELLHDLQAARERHDGAVQAFLEVGALDPTALTDAAAVKARTDALEAFCKENEALRALIEGMPQDYERRARAQGVDDKAVAAALEGFMKGFPQQDLIAMRDLDRRFCAAARTQLSILGTRPSHWTLAADGLSFDETVPDEEVDRFDVAGREIEAVAQEQTELEKRLYAR